MVISMRVVVAAAALIFSVESVRLVDEAAPPPVSGDDPLSSAPPAAPQVGSGKKPPGEDDKDVDSPGDQIYILRVYPRPVKMLLRPDQDPFSTQIQKAKTKRRENKNKKKKMKEMMAKLQGASLLDMTEDGKPKPSPADIVAKSPVSDEDAPKKVEKVEKVEKKVEKKKEEKKPMNLGKMKTEVDLRRMTGEVKSPDEGLFLMRISSGSVFEMISEVAGSFEHRGDGAKKDAALFEKNETVLPAQEMDVHDDTLEFPDGKAAVTTKVTDNLPPLKIEKPGKGGVGSNKGTMNMMYQSKEPTPKMKAKMKANGVSGDLVDKFKLLIWPKPESISVMAADPTPMHDEKKKKEQKKKSSKKEEEEELDLDLDDDIDALGKEPEMPANSALLDTTEEDEDDEDEEGDPDPEVMKEIQAPSKVDDTPKTEEEGSAKRRLDTMGMPGMYMITISSGAKFSLTGYNTRIR